MSTSLNNFIAQSNNQLYSQHLIVKNHFYGTKDYKDGYNLSNDWNHGKKLCDDAIAVCNKIIEESGDIICSEKSHKKLLRKYLTHVSKISEIFNREKEIAKSYYNSNLFVKYGVGTTLGLTVIAPLQTVAKSYGLINTIPYLADFPVHTLVVGVSLGVLAGIVYPAFKVSNTPLYDLGAMIKNIEKTREIFFQDKEITVLQN